MRNVNSLALAASVALTACVLDWSNPHLGDDSTTGDQVANDSTTGDHVARPCEGEQVAGACWTLAAAGAGCSSGCTDRGGYDDATATIAGAAGTDAACAEVLDALGVPAGPLAVVGASSGAGCLFNTASARRYRIGAPATTAEASGPSWQRACACEW